MGRPNGIDPNTLIVHLSDVQHAFVGLDGSVLAGPNTLRYGTGQVGIAPGLDGRIAISPPYDEDNPQTPDGKYCMHLARVVAPE